MAKEDVGRYVLPTVAGVFHLACQKREETSASLLFSKIFSEKKLAKLTVQEIQEIMGLSDVEFANEILTIYAMDWVEELDEAIELPDVNMETILPKLLSTLSSDGTALLADEEGFCLLSAGFSDEEEEALSAMAADLANVYNKYESRYDNLLSSRAWGMIDAGGNCQMGVWPMHLGNHNFNLFIKGVPILNHPNFVIIAWLLHHRYCNS